MPGNIFEISRYIIYEIRYRFDLQIDLNSNTEMITKHQSTAEKSLLMEKEIYLIEKALNLNMLLEKVALFIHILHEVSISVEDDISIYYL